MTGVVALLVNVLIGLAVLGVLIVVHELGHFLLAKLNGVGVLEFSIGFGRKIWQKRIGGTRYSLGIVPLGGYVRMVGDDPHDAYETETLAERALEPVVPSQDAEVKSMLHDKRRWFLERGYWVKSAVVLAGPGFNYLFAILLAVFTFSYYGIDKVLNVPVIGETIPDLPAEKSGLLSGDRVISINGREMKEWRELAETVRGSSGETMSFAVERTVGGQPRRVDLQLAGVPENPELALVNGTAHTASYVIGIAPKVESVEISFSEACRLGVRHVWGMTVMSVRSFALLVTGSISAKNIGGPISIMKYAAQYAEKGLEKLYLFMIFLSISLAILNLLPIPILDGGHLVFFTIEALKGSPVNVRVQEIANNVGLVLLLALMIFAVGNDVVRIFQ